MNLLQPLISFELGLVFATGQKYLIAELLQKLNAIMGLRPAMIHQHGFILLHPRAFPAREDKPVKIIL